MTNSSPLPGSSWRGRKGAFCALCLVAGLAGGRPALARGRNDAPSDAGPEASPPAAERSIDPAVSGSAAFDQAGDPNAGFPLIEATDEPEYWRRNLFKRFFGDQKYLVTTWWRSEMRNTGFLIPLVATTAVAMGDQGTEGVDYRLEGSVRAWHGWPGRGASRAITALGDGKVDVVLVGGTWLLARWAGNHRLARASSLSAEGLLSTALWVSAIKTLTERTRPSGGGDGTFFRDRNGPGQQTDSFPSGHTMGAFTVATVFSLEYGDKRWVPWVAYGTAGLVGVSRVSLGRHFPSDVVVGALLGYSIGRMVMARQGESSGRAMLRHVQPILDPAGGAYGLGYSRSW